MSQARRKRLPAHLVVMPAIASLTAVSTYSAGGSFSDPGGSGWTETVNFGAGSGHGFVTASPRGNEADSQRVGDPWLKR
jgi:hypothetical protein